MGLLVLRSIINVLEVPLNPNITNVLEVLIRTIIDVLEAPLNRTITSHLEVFPMSLLRGLSTTMSKFKGYFELFFDLFWVLIHSYVIVFIIFTITLLQDAQLTAVQLVCQDLPNIGELPSSTNFTAGVSFL